MKIAEIIEIIDKHIKIYQEEIILSDYMDNIYEHGKVDGAIEALIDLRNEFARKLKNEKTML